MQQEIPLTAFSRVAAYDALGSFALAPVGTVVAGPLAGIFGTAAVLNVGGALIVVLTALVLLVPEVRHLRRETPARPTPPSRDSSKEHFPDQPGEGWNASRRRRTASESRSSRLQNAKRTWLRPTATLS
jgi:hypothetical protein